eukprot:TRINITY_DN1485_c0_g1_i1.p1 TRINITY_DN1485_c0_g1~~TRINITY_DN1485_c0_g1_i1.p1  ORF type:complete len:186 (+),score=66.28 TRINITY_DN1485_c0_g1_i1:127-684(+)
MGNLLSALRLLSVFDKREARIVMLGLDAAGKTTVLYRLRLGDVVTSIPTIGFNVETIEYKRLRLTVWDVGGQTRIRALWRHYYQGTNAVIYVVDSSDKDRAEEARDELEGVLASDELRGASLLVLANKQDLVAGGAGGMSTAQVAEALGLPHIKDRKWFIQGTSATTGNGIYEGLDWLASNLEKV